MTQGATENRLIKGGGLVEINCGISVNGVHHFFSH